jgi:cell division protein FtsQ
VRTPGPGTPGARRRARRDTPRPSEPTRERNVEGRSTGMPRDRHFGKTNRVKRGSRFPNGDHEGSVSERGAAPHATQPGAGVAPDLMSRPPSPVRTRRIQTRWPQTRWLWLVAGVVTLTLVGGGAWVLLASSLFDARTVEVAGTRDLAVDEVRTVAAVPVGTPMLRLDTEAIQSRVAAMPRVASVQVRCTLDGTVRIQLAERIPVAVVRRGSGVHLVDATGADYAAVSVGPPGLPELRTARVGPRDAATMAALTVLTGLPQQLRAQVRAVAAKSPAGVVLRLGDGREVRWGGVEQGARKSAVLGPLLTQPGNVYDVSSPALPTIT